MTLIIFVHNRRNKRHEKYRFSVPFSFFHCRIPLPEIKICGSWNVLNTCRNVSVQERNIKLKSPMFPTQNTRILDRVEARSAWFTELQSYWALPIGENSTVTALTVANGNKGDGMDDRIHVLTANPLSVFSMTLESENVLETSLQGLISPNRGNMPFYSIAADNLGNVLVHEETVSNASTSASHSMHVTITVHRESIVDCFQSNSVLMVNVSEGSVRELQLSSLLDTASDRISNAFRSKDYQWKMRADLLSSHNLIVLYTHGQNKIETINLQNMCAYSMNLPCDIESVLLASDNKWLVQATSRNKYVLVKSSDADPCPHVLRELDESNSTDIKTGRVLNCGQNGLHKEDLSKAVQQQVDAPSRVIASDNTYAGIAIGFPDLDSTNDLHFWPRRKRIRDSMTPIVTQNGQVIRTISSDQVPDEVCPKDNKHMGISGYLEIVDTVNQKLRYVPIPE